MVTADPNPAKQAVSSGNTADKKKRKRQKHKNRKSSMTTTTTTSTSTTTDTKPNVLASPRQQTIMRHKLDETTNEQVHPLTLLNHLKRNNFYQETHEPIELRSSDIAQKLTLFKYKSGTILQFLDQIKHNSTGTLLAQGEIEIFQLHNGDVTYLSCGKSFIYPLLPKIKILRASFNQFIIPLVNPERYWKLNVTTEENNVIDLLECTFEKYVQYRNLYVNSNHISNQSPILKFTLDDTIPESPPSAPISPHNEMTAPPQMSLIDPIPNTLLHHPKPRLNPNYNPFHTSLPLHQEDTKSDLDSLLDEYEHSLKGESRPNSIIHPHESLSRSRRSSISELYTLESGWMEPNPQTTTKANTTNRSIAKSRSIYSMNSYRSYDLNHIYNTMRQGHQEREELKSTRSMSKLPNDYHDYRTRFPPKQKHTTAPVPPPPTAKTQTTRNTQLDSREIFNMLSSKPKPKPPRPTSFASRIFGWG